MLRSSPTTRQAILAYLDKHKQATATQLSRALKVSAADIRYHLTTLVKEGLLETADRRIQGRGRPRQVYIPGAASQVNGFLDLVQALLSGIPSQHYQDIINAAARNLAGSLPDPSKNLSQKLVHTVQRLNQLHYQARWEAHAEAPRIIFSHCPYLSIIGEFPQLCQLDICLLQVLSGHGIHQTARLETAESGERTCQFQILFH